MFAIVGYGFVGKGTEHLLKICGNSEVEIQDPAIGYEVADWSKVKYAFICVPTPEKYGVLDLSILTEVYQQALSNNVIPVIRSTIGPDQVSEFPRAIMMPEFLREAHWKSDTESLPNVILGGDVQPDLISAFSSKNVVTVDAVTAMMFKIARNAALAVKVTMANEMYNICNNYNVDYDNLVKLFVQDNSVGQSHWAVPGPDGQFGFGGKCFPKDLIHFADLCAGNINNIFNAALLSNKTFRKE